MTRSVLQPAPDAPSPVGGEELVLVVDDEPGVRRFVSAALRLAGYAVAAAGSGAEAVAHARAARGRVALLLCDMVMPDAGGRGVAERVRAEAPGVPVLYMSGHHDDTVLDFGIEDGVVHFLAKPFSSAELARKVREALDAGRHSLGGLLGPG